jgi:hypothetical protein
MRSRAVASEGTVDIFATASLRNRDISMLSDEFLAEVQGLRQRNQPVEMQGKLFNDEITQRSQQAFVEARFFKDMLEEAVRKGTRFINFALSPKPGPSSELRRGAPACQVIVSRWTRSSREADSHRSRSATARRLRGRS